MHTARAAARAKKHAPRRDERRSEKCPPHRAGANKTNTSTTRPPSTPTSAVAMPDTRADQHYAQRVCKNMAALVLQAEAVRDHRLQIADITTPAHSTALTTIQSESPLDLQRELQLHQAFCSRPLTAHGDRSAQQALNDRQAVRTASLDRAAAGCVKLKVNAQRPRATARLASITTPAEYQRVTAQWVRDLLVDSLTVEYRGSRISVIGHWQVHCNEGYRLSFVRIEWLSAGTMPLVLTFEENLALSFFGQMVYRLKGLGPVIAWTHVRQFHISIGITPPPMVRLQNAMRLLRHKLKRGAVHTDNRGCATPSYVRALARYYRQRKDNCALAWAVRLVYALKLVILCLAYQLAMRIIELARGATYNHAIHWAVKHFDRAGALTVASGEYITMKPTQRKCPTAAALRPVPILYLDDCEINALRAYRELREMDPATEHSERNHCAFRVNSKGSAPSSTWYRKEFTEELLAACPDAPVNIRQTPHILRRGALSAHVHNGIDPVVIDIIAVLAPNSTRAIYTGHMPSAIIDAQRRLPTADFTALQNSQDHVYPDTSDPETLEWQPDERPDTDSDEETTTWALPQASEPTRKRPKAARITLAKAAQSQPSIRHAFQAAQATPRMHTTASATPATNKATPAAPTASPPGPPPPQAPALSLADQGRARSDRAPTTRRHPEHAH